jgi:hypothetical protein
MTTICWKYSNGTITMLWDNKVCWWFNIVNNTTRKIIQLWNSLVWTSWDYVDVNWLKEMHEVFEWEHWEIDTKIKAMIFFNMVLKTVWKEDISMMILNDNFRIIIAQWLMENMEIEDEEWFFSMWSWHSIALSLYKYNNDIKDDEIYNIASSLDIKTTRTFTKLILNKWALKSRFTRKPIIEKISSWQGTDEQEKVMPWLNGEKKTDEKK